MRMKNSTDSEYEWIRQQQQHHIEDYVDVDELRVKVNLVT